MPRIGITGHANLTPTASPHILKALENELAPDAEENLVGVTCLAKGADQLFAQAVLNLGGQLEVVLPAADYRQRKVKPDNAAQFDNLLDQASHVHTMPYEQSHREAYMAASQHLLDSVDKLIAVWDGQPASGHGGTADVVQTAHDHNIPVSIVWPDGAERE